MFTVVTPATDLTLLSVIELRQAAGVADASMDATLIPMEARAAAAISEICNVARGGINPPTLRSEVVRDTYRFEHYRSMRYSSELLLSRMFVSSIASVTVDGVVLPATDYELDDAAGIIYRLRDDRRAFWCGLKIVVEYTAGFVTVPHDLKMAASKMVSTYYAATPQPSAGGATVGTVGSIKKEKVEGVSEIEYYALSSSSSSSTSSSGSSSSSSSYGVGADVIGLLMAYRRERLI